MALTRITKGVIKPNENYDTHNINSTGIVTATGANITGNLTVGGVLTYEDVTSIDSVGIVTGEHARNLIHFESKTLDKICIGDQIDIITHGRGLKLLDFPTKPGWHGGCRRRRSACSLTANCFQFSSFHPSSDLTILQRVSQS